MSVIEFLCPNGHRIRCQSEQAGRAAKCPRCGVKFRVPKDTDPNVSGAVGSDSSVSPPDFTDSSVSGKKTTTPAAGKMSEPEMEFLCPNGHLLHGPVSLQGRPGECPDCGSRFRIPTLEEIAAEDEEEEELGLAETAGNLSTKGLDADMLADLEPAPTPPPASKKPASLEESTTRTTISGRGETGQSMAALVTRLWDCRPKGSIVELKLRNGDVIIPQQFLKKLSQQSRHGAFAVKEADGTLSLVVTAWDVVDRATLRRLDELPKGLSE